MNQIINRILLFLICSILCMNAFSVTETTVIALLLSILFSLHNFTITRDICIRKFKIPDYAIHFCITALSFLLSFFMPELAVYLPLFCMHLLQKPMFYLLPAPIVSLILLAREIPLSSSALLFVLCVFGVFTEQLSIRNDALNRKIKYLHDTSEYNQILAKENIKMMQKNQDNMIYTATLQERNRIAREIHDNVGHMITRSILQLGAIKIVNKEPVLTKPLDELHTTLDTAMTSIRTSVHDLHDNAVDLQGAVCDILNHTADFETSLEYDMSAVIPKDIKYCFISIVKEAVTNTTKHSNGNAILVTIREHPGFYQLTIADNGRNIQINKTDGIGLINIHDRVHALSGNVQIRTDSGFQLFVTIPKYNLAAS